MLQAKATAKYTEQQVLQAEETARQGQTLMLFTVVTILFVRNGQISTLWQNH